MRKKVLLLLLSVLLCIAGCGKEGFRENEQIGNILGGGAIGRDAQKNAGKSESPENTGNLGNPNADTAFDALPDTPVAGDQATYYKLRNGIAVSVEGGTYTIGEAVGTVTVSVVDADGQIIASETIADYATAPKGVITAAQLEVPNGGQLICSGGNCVAQLNK